MMKAKNFLVIVFSFLFVLLFVFVTLFMIHVKRTDSIVLKDDLSCQFREKVYTDDFIADINGEVLSKNLVDTSSIGKKRVLIQFKNRYGFVENKYFYVNVKDSVAPIINIDDVYEVNVGEINNLIDNIFCADNYDDGVSCVIEGNYDLNTVGDYPLKIFAKDKSGNESKKEFVLRVKNKDVDTSSKKDIDFKDFYNKYKNDNTEIGISVSDVNGEVDYSELVDKGVSFVMIRVGSQNEIGGSISKDVSFDINVKKALEKGLNVGLYFSSNASSENEARKQAKWVVQNIKSYDLGLPVMFDWNNWEYYSRFKIGFRSLNDIALSFVKEINRSGYDAGIYSSYYYLENVWYGEEYKYIWKDSSSNGNFFMWGIDGFNVLNNSWAK